MAPRASLVAATAVVLAAAQNSTCVSTQSLYVPSFNFTYINGTPSDLSVFAGHVTILTNTASF